MVEVTACGRAKSGQSRTQLLKGTIGGKALAANSCRSSYQFRRVLVRFHPLLEGRFEIYSAGKNSTKIAAGKFALELPSDKMWEPCLKASKTLPQGRLTIQALTSTTTHTRRTERPECKAESICPRCHHRSPRHAGPLHTKILLAINKRPVHLNPFSSLERNVKVTVHDP